MYFSIRHKTVYQYSEPVFLEPQIIRLKPKTNCTQRLIRHQYTISPHPSGQSGRVGLDDHDTLYAWFEDLVSTFEIVAESTVETLRENPFDFILTNPGSIQIPIQYPEQYSERLKPYLMRKNPSETVDQLTETLLQETHHNSIFFITQMNTWIYQNIQTRHREKGNPQPPDETVKKETGACRDLAVLFIDICRCAGIASRFVSGYQAEESNKEHVNTHAWAEIYLPEAGWRGFDPTHGLAVDNRYVAVSSGPEYRDASPVSGTFRGTNATSNLSYSISIKTSERLEDIT